MVRIAALFLSLIGSVTLLGSAALAQPANGYYGVTLAAQPANGYYGVTLAAQPEAAKQVVRGMVFTCAGANCAAGEGTSRPAIICASVARELGPVTSFRAGDEALDGEALAKCNAKADTTKIARR